MKTRLKLGFVLGSLVLYREYKQDGQITRCKVLFCCGFPYKFRREEPNQ